MKRLWLHALLVAAIGVIVALSFARDAPDTARYLEEGRSLALRGFLSHDSVTSTTRDTPGFPLLIAAFVGAGLDPMFWMRVLNGVWAGLIGAGCGRVVRVLLEGRAGRNLWPVVAVYAGGLYPTVAGTLLFVLTEPPYTALWLWSHVFVLEAISSAGRNGWSRWAAAGFLLALACYVRPVPLFYPAILLPVAVYGAVFREGNRSRRGLVQRSCRAAVFLLVMAAAIVPWTVRNYRVTGRFVPMNDGAGLHLWIGASQQWRGEYPDFEPSDAMVAAGMSFGEASDRLGAEAKEIIRRDPVAWLKLMPLKWKRLWIEVPAGKQQIGSSAIKSALQAVSFVTVVLAAVGLYLRRRDPEAWIMILPAVYTTAIHTVLFSIARFRIPAEPYLVCLAIVAVSTLVAARGSSSAVARR
jgi:hypothetical protein